MPTSVLSDSLSSTESWLHTLKAVLEGAALSKAEGLKWLECATPDKVTPSLFSQAISLLEQVAMPAELKELFHLYAKPQSLLDCCGTGGSGLPHYNTSTTVAFVLAAAGIPVAKFGNRAASSSSGSFDFLEQIGFPVLKHPKDGLTMLEETNLGFLYAPQVYPAMKHLGPLRKQLGQPTIFNFMGPLLNPLKPAYRVTGVSKQAIAPTMATWLSQQAFHQNGLLVRSHSGLDERAPGHSSTLWQITSNQVTEHTAPSISQAPEALSDLDWSATANAERFERLVTQATPMPYIQELVIQNSALGLWIAGKASSIEEGETLASELLQSGAVLAKVKQCRTVSERLG